MYENKALKNNYYNDGNYILNNDQQGEKPHGPSPVGIRRAVLAIGVLTMLLTAFLVGAPYWRTTARWNTVSLVVNVWQFEGLFLSCVKEGNQMYSQCFQLYTIMGTTDGTAGQESGKDYFIYPYLNAFRALMIIGFVCSVAGVVCSALGMRCTSALEEDGKAKRWIVICGGILHIAAGVLTGITVSWYAAEVVREYYSIYYQTSKMKYTLGACLYVGWVSMFFSLVCGCLMTCCTCFSKPVDKQPHAYQPATYALPPTNNVQAYKPIVSEYASSRPSDHHRLSSHRHDRSRRDRRQHNDRRSSSPDTSSYRYTSSKSSRPESHQDPRASGFV